MGLPTIKFYLDKRKCKNDELAQIKISICHKSKVAYIVTNIRIKPSQWDAKAEKVVRHPQKSIITDYLNAKRIEIGSIMIELEEQGKLSNKSITEIRTSIINRIEGNDRHITFCEYYNSFCEKKKGRTKGIYETTAKRITEFDERVKEKHFEDISVDWLHDFDAYLSISSPSKNARNIHLRNIRAVFNNAIKNDVTSVYPFRRFQIKGVQTPKRSLTIEQLRNIFFIEDSNIQYDIDMFKLMFLFIGINLTDLYNLKNICNGRIEYYRAKTHKLYSIKVEPEALHIINKYKGRKYLLNLSEKYSTANNFKSSINKRLKQIYPKLSTYWARHTWATIAAELDIPIEIISHALGHSYGSETTAIYIRFNEKKVDKANRMVIDYVLNKNNLNNIR